MIAPILDEIASEYTGKIKAPSSHRREPANAARLRIRGIPTLMLSKMVTSKPPGRPLFEIAADGLIDSHL